MNNNMHNMPAFDREDETKPIPVMPTLKRRAPIISNNMSDALKRLDELIDDVNDLIWRMNNPRHK
jgi:hypothetical protein